MNSEDKDKFIRWQDYRIQQLSYSINLFLGFGVATLGFLLNQQNVIEYKTVILLCLFSVVSGSIATVSRLLDFRYTARKIRSGSWIFPSAKHLGEITWSFFWAQVLFYLGTIGYYVFIKLN